MLCSRMQQRRQVFPKVLLGGAMAFVLRADFPVENFETEFRFGGPPRVKVQ